jgi:hypothetical protein
MEKAPTIVADYCQTGDFTDPWRTRQGNLLLASGVRQSRCDELSGLHQLASQHDRAILARRHQVKLVTDSLPPFEGNFEEFAKLLVRDFPVGVH